MIEQIAKYPKVLVGCPIHEVKRYVTDEWLNCISNFSYPNYSIHLADNSPTNIFQKELQARGYSVSWQSPKNKTLYEAMKDSHNACVTKILEDKTIEYFLHLECDVFPPCLDIIDRLLMHNKPVVSAMYHIGDGPNKCVLLAQTVHSDKYGIETNNLNVANDITFIDGKLKQIFSAGLGCTLIHRSVFDTIKFRVEPNSDKHPDTWFCLDLFKNKIPNYVDTSLICTHKNSNWSHILK